MERVRVQNIHQPVGLAGTNSQNPGQMYRIPKSAPHVNASQRWWIELFFNADVDVAVFEKALTGSPVRFIEFDGRFFIEDSRMPDVGDPIENGFTPIEAYAAEELPRLNTAVKLICPQFVPATLRCIVYISDKGEGHPISTAQTVAHGLNDLSTMVTFLNEAQPKTTSVLHLYAINADVREAMFYFGLEGNPWPNLYKAREIIADAVGGDRGMFDKRWCSRNELERFDRTANHQEAIGQFSRHARSKVVPPANPMTDSDARAFIFSLIKEWVEHLLREGAKENGTSSREALDCSK